MDTGSPPVMTVAEPAHTDVTCGRRKENATVKGKAMRWRYGLVLLKTGRKMPFGLAKTPQDSANSRNCHPVAERTTCSYRTARGRGGVTTETSNLSQTFPAGRSIGTSLRGQVKDYLCPGQQQRP